jgi:hypothetical protein
MPAVFKTYVLRELADKDTEIEEKNEGLVLGVGIGVFFVIFAMIVGFIMCVVGLATNIWMVCFIMGVTLPLVIFLIVAFAPKHKDVEEEDDDRTDEYIVPRVIVLIIIIVSALLAALQVLDFYFGVNLQARRVESKIEETALAEELDRQNRVDDDALPGEVEAHAPVELVPAGRHHGHGHGHSRSHSSSSSSS